MARMNLTRRNQPPNKDHPPPKPPTNKHPRAGRQTTKDTRSRLDVIRHPLRAGNHDHHVRIASSLGVDVGGMRLRPAGPGGQKTPRRPPRYPPPTTEQPPLVDPAAPATCGWRVKNPHPWPTHHPGNTHPDTMPARARRGICPSCLHAWRTQKVSGCKPRMSVFGRPGPWLVAPRCPAGPASHPTHTPARPPTKTRMEHAWTRVLDGGPPPTCWPAHPQGRGTPQQTSGPPNNNGHGIKGLAFQTGRRLSMQGIGVCVLSLRPRHQQQKHQGTWGQGGIALRASGPTHQWSISVRACTPTHQQGVYSLRAGGPTHQQGSTLRAGGPTTRLLISDTVRMDSGPAVQQQGF